MLRFAKLVNKGIGRVETVLKVVMTPSDPADGMIDNYILLVGDKNVNNFTKILELKVRTVGGLLTPTDDYFQLKAPRFSPPLGT